MLHNTVVMQLGRWDAGCSWTGQLTALPVSSFALAAGMLSDSELSDICEELAAQLGIDDWNDAEPAKTADDDEDCELCLQVLLEDDRSKHSKFRFKRLHKKCFNALHSLERIGERSEKLKKSLISLRNSDPEKFRMIAMSLVVKEKRARDPISRAKATDFLEQLIVKSNVKRKGRALLMDHDAYIAWYALNYRMSDEQCEAKWRQDKKDRNVHKEYENGQLVIAVRQFTELSSSNSISRVGQGTDREAAKRMVAKMPNLSAMADDPDLHGIPGASAALRLRGSSQASLMIRARVESLGGLPA